MFNQLSLDLEMDQNSSEKQEETVDQGFVQLSIYDIVDEESSS